jgi:hypothetical protein
VEAADGVFVWNIAVAPASLVLGAGNAHQGQTHPIGIGERQHRFAKALFQRLKGDALFDEAMRPVAERARRHPERGLLGLADPTAARCGMLPREEGEDGAGMAGLVTVVEMVGAGIVKIDRLLDEPQAQRSGVKVEVSQRITGNCGDMMDA